jgi:hypothetical protein
MARPSDNRRDEAIATIRRLCTQHGTKDGGRLARQQFADIPIGTWGHWRVDALGPAPDRAERERDARIAVAAEVRESIPPMTKLVSTDAQALPAARRALDFWRMIDELDEDARLLRDYAVTTMPDGTRKLRVPFALRDAHRMRTDLMRLALQHAEIAWSTERAQKYQEAIIAAIGEVSPDVQRLVVNRVRRLQSEFRDREGV